MKNTITGIIAAGYRYPSTWYSTTGGSDPHDDLRVVVPRHSDGECPAQLAEELPREFENSVILIVEIGLVHVVSPARYGT